MLMMLVIRQQNKIGLDKDCPEHLEQQIHGKYRKKLLKHEIATALIFSGVALFAFVSVFICAFGAETS